MNHHTIIVSVSFPFSLYILKKLLFVLTRLLIKFSNSELSGEIRRKDFISGLIVLLINSSSKKFNLGMLKIINYIFFTCNLPDTCCFYKYVCFVQCQAYICRMN